jgi:hypothetical protein
MSPCANRCQLLSPTEQKPSPVSAQNVPAPNTVKVSELTRAFVDAEPSKKVSTKAAVIPEVKDIDIRDLGVALRSALGAPHYTLNHYQGR